MVSGCTVCSEASNGVGLGASGTFARPPALASRKNEIFIPRKMELKGWITDCARSSFHGITLNAVMLFRLVEDWYRMNFTSTLTGTQPGRSKGIG